MAALLWVLASWTWLSAEAGLCEEFLFRACLQSRLAAWLEIAGRRHRVDLGHLRPRPLAGIYLRGGPGVDGWSTDPIQVAAFTIATLSPLSVALGLLWARSRSLLLIVLGPWLDRRVAAHCRDVADLELAWRLRSLGRRIW